MSSRERLAALAVEHDDAHRALEADEEIVLPALVVVQPADHALAREETFVWRIGFGSSDERMSSVNQPRSSSKRRSGMRRTPIDHCCSRRSRARSR